MLKMVFMKKNEIKNHSFINYFGIYFFLLFTDVFFKCCLIEMKSFKKESFSHEQLFAKCLFLIANHLNQQPTTTIYTLSLVNKKSYATIATMIKKAINMINHSKIHREKYDCTNLRKNWLIKQMALCDATLSFTIFQENKKILIAYTNLTSKNTVLSMSKCLNYLSKKTDLPIFTLSHLCPCLLYLKYYTFLYKDRFNLYNSHHQCILL